MIDIQLLRILKYRAEFAKVYGRVPEAAIEKTTRVLIKDFRKYYQAHPDHTSIDSATFQTMFNAWHPTLKSEQSQQYANILKRVFETDVPENEQDAILYTLLELRMGAELQELLVQFDSGEVADIANKVTAISDAFRVDARVRSLDFVRPDVDALLAADENHTGLRSRLSCLNANMRPLRDGDFGIVAGRPDRGKTTYLASELTFFAAQTERQIIWLNNEGPGSRIYPRLWQAALGVRTTELIQLHQRGRLIPEYEAAIKGDQFKIRVFDIHGNDNYAVERILDSNPACLVVYDMIDNVRGFNDAPRTDLGLEMKYQWARELCVKYELAGIATSQISVDGANMMFPADHMLKDSKTGKQGACDFIIMIGSVDDPGMQSQRFIGTPKNKLRVEGSDGNPMAAVHYKPQIARYEDTKVLGSDEYTDGDET